jgi:hypothetical protein
MRGQVVNSAEGQGPRCLHLGRSGERCGRPAFEDGFCESHGPDATWRFGTAARRKFMAVLLGIAVLWPWLADLWHAIQHLRR